MEIRFTEALPLERTLKNGMVSADARRQGTPSITVIPSEAFMQARAGQAEQAGDAEKTERERANPWGFNEDAVKDVVKQTSELLSAFDRQLKYEMKDEAGVVQVQVVDSRDGRVIREVPADEIIKFLEQMKARIDDVNEDDKIDERIDLIA